MSGWTFEVTVTQVRRKSKTVTVRAFTQDEAIEYAKVTAAGMEWDGQTRHTEYEARELT